VTFCYGHVSFCPYNANSNLTRRYKVTRHLKHIHVSYPRNYDKYTFFFLYSTNIRRGHAVA
jgi:hypothetical protein